ncbi:hypothetical protein B9Z55_015885 [Caenorhabditis nigoni]|uniref:Sdz-33 F-box domain-containing protein n=1 Tax=Caenorhabditis nigoni TaxID=1611254 RepID=A0A2G5UCT3_9PELO|nr:hypothetical protein B9Z55_015885 [Caenorhabditis nigoni]
MTHGKDISKWVVPTRDAVYYWLAHGKVHTKYLGEQTHSVTISFCSQNLKCLLRKRYQQNKPSQWKLYMKDCHSLGIIGIDYCRMRKRTIVLVSAPISELNGAEHGLIEANGYKRGFSSKYPFLFFKDRVMGSKMIVEYVTELLNLDIYELTVDRNGIWAINWIDNRQKKSLGCLALDKNPDDSLNGDEAVEYVLRNARASYCLGISDNVSDNFRFDGKLGPAENFVIQSYGHWVTLNNLINFDLISIAIVGSRLSVSDLFSFLRHWRVGGSPRLTFLFLRFENDSTFSGNFDEDLEVVETNEVGRYRILDKELVIKGGYSIQRMDGGKATIQWNFECFRMVVWHETATENGV